MSVRVKLIGPKGDSAVVENADDAIITGANILVVLLPGGARQIFTLSHFVTVTVEPVAEAANEPQILLPETPGA